MIIETTGFLGSDALRFLRGLYEECPRADGKETAGSEIGKFKENVELELGERAQAVKEAILTACNEAPVLGYAVLPRMVTRPILSLYEPGMHYGSHMDSAIGYDDGRLYRSDISCTVFLDDPSAYDGGELLIESDTSSQRFKLPAGSAVFYSTLYDHEVLEVSRGVRRACVFWIESLVRDPQKRRILFDIAQLGEWIGQREPVDSDIRRTAVRARENLYRMWLEG